MQYHGKHKKMPKAIEKHIQNITWSQLNHPSFAKLAMPFSST